MRAITVAALCFGLSAAIIDAHVTVIPRESQAGAVERYTVRVPTEGQVTTTSVELEVPAGLIVTEVVPGAAYTYDVRRDGSRVVAITWTQEIPPKASAEFVFVARNPAGGQLAWKARQQFADGTSADWVGVEGDRRPASVTKIVPGRP